MTVTKEPRTFVEVLPEDAQPGTLEDKKLRFMRRVLFLARRWRNQMDEDLRSSGDNHARWIALLWIDMLDGKANLRELSERVGVELPTLIRLLNRLEKEGLVKRRPLPGQASAKTVVLTAKGRPALANMSRIVRTTRDEFLRGIEDDELDAALVLLDKLLARHVRVVTWNGRHE